MSQSCPAMGALLRESRLSAGLTLSAVAGSVGYRSSGAIAHIEHGRRVLDLVQWARLYQSVGVPPDAAGEAAAADGYPMSELLPALIGAVQ